MSTHANDRVFTLAEVAQLPDDSWVNGAVTARVLKVETIAKKPPKVGSFYKAHLSDGGAEPLASLSLFVAPKFTDGDDIRLTGSGIKKGSYNGKVQISIGKDTAIEVRAGTQRVANAAHGAQAEQANGCLISGPAAGMALKTALDIHTKDMPRADVILKLSAPGFWNDVYVTACDVIRVQQMLEKGKLAATVRERSHQMPATPPVVQRAAAPAPVSESDFDADEPPPF